MFIKPPLVMSAQSLSGPSTAQARDPRRKHGPRLLPTTFLIQVANARARANRIRNLVGQGGNVIGAAAAVTGNQGGISIRIELTPVSAISGAGVGTVHLERGLVVGRVGVASDKGRRVADAGRRGRRAARC